MIRCLRKSQAVQALINSMPKAPDHQRPLGPFVDAPHQIAELGDLTLESGATIAEYRQSYVTHGRLNAARDNVVLVCAAIGSNHHRLDFLLGADGALSPARWFVVAVDPIGNGLSTSPSNSRVQPRMRFPRFTIRDMVRAQHCLLTEHLRIISLAAVVGASMGGMQALQWAVSHPQMMDRVVAMTPMARTAPWSTAINEVSRLCLMSDPAWNGREFEAVPERGWRAWAGVLKLIANRTPAAVAADCPNSAALLEWLAERQRPYLDGSFDAHDWLYQSWAYDAHDVGTTPGFDGDTAAALRAVQSRTLILAPPLDLYNPVDAAEFASACIPDCRLVEIPSRQGHQAAGAVDRADVAFLNRTIGAFIAEGSG